MYGGAGVHVEHLAAELARLVDVVVHCMGGPRPGAIAHQPWTELAGANPTLGVLSTDLAMAAAAGDRDLVHSHTWYASIAGHLAGLLHGIPHVVTAHSLEPLRPWKAEQLGGGYAISGWCERTAIEAADAVIAVSEAMRTDVLRCYPGVPPSRVSVVHNGIDTVRFAPDPGSGALDRLGIDRDRPYLLFVGRITRQKGLTHLLDAAELIRANAQLVLCAAAPDTPELGAHVDQRVRDLASAGRSVLLVAEPVPRGDLVQLLSHARAFVCPSIYEPLGIVNLEAMACATPVVAGRVGGIPEVVADGTTGILVEVDQDPDGTPRDPARFAADLAAALDTLLDDPELADRLGRAGRERAIGEFSWARAAQRTLEVYLQVLA